MTPPTVAIETIAAPRPTERRRITGRVMRGGFILFATRLVMQGFVWGVSLTVIRLLKPDDYGVMTWGTIFLEFCDLLAAAGLVQTLVHKEELHPDDLASAFTFSLGMSAALYAVLFTIAPFVSDVLHLGMPELGPFLRVLGLMVLLVPFRAGPQVLLDRDLRMGRQAVVHILCSVVQAGIVLSLALAGMGYWALASGAMAGRLLECVTLIYASGWRPRLHWSIPIVRRLLGFGVHVSLSSVLWFIYSNCDFTIVGKLSGPEALGFYAVAFQLISMPVQKLTANINTVVFPIYCRLKGDRPRLRNWYLRLTVLLGFLAMPLMAGMALVAEDAFTLLLRPRWQPAVLPFQLLSTVGILMVYGASVPPLLMALGRPDLNLRYTATCAVVYPIGFLIGATLGSVTGVCIAWLILYPLMFTTLVTMTRSVTGVAPLDLLRAQRPVLGAVLVMVGVVLTVRWGLEDSRLWLRLVLAIAAGAATYAGVLLVVTRRTLLPDLRALLGELRSGRG